VLVDGHWIKDDGHRSSRLPLAEEDDVLAGGLPRVDRKVKLGRRFGASVSGPVEGQIDPGGMPMVQSVSGIRVHGGCQCLEGYASVAIDPGGDAGLAPPGPKLGDDGHRVRG